jgi:hypothetical protein
MVSILGKSLFRSSCNLLLVELSEIRKSKSFISWFKIELIASTADLGRL